MKRLSLISLVCLALAAPAPAAEPAPTDALTTYGKTLFAGEISHGSQVKISSVFSAAITTDTEGRTIAYNSIMGSPGKLVINELLTGKQLKAFPLAKLSAGSYATLVHSSGDIYLSSHPHGVLYRYRPGADELENLGQVHPNVKFIWELEEIADGKLALACYPDSRVIVFDPADDSFKDLGSAKEGEDYARAVGYHAPTNRLFVGVGSHPALICWNLETGEKKDILPEVDDSDSTVYSVDMVGDKVVTRMSPSIKGLVFDANTLELYDRVDALGGSIISGLAPDGESYYFTVGEKLYRHNLKTKEKTEVAEVAGNTRAIGFPIADGQQLVASIAYNGTVSLVNPEDGTVRTIKQDLPTEPIDIHSLYGGPDNRLYSSGYVVGALGVFDPATSKSIQVQDIPQTEGASYAGNVMFLGTYPRARIFRYEVDPAKHTNVIEGENPKELFRLEDYNQDRPYGMLGIPETNQCAIGTIPGYGKLGGVICIYNDDDKTSKVYDQILGKRSAVSLAHKDGILYIGTTISGGLGVDPAEKEAALIGMDIKTGEKLFETVPVPDMRIIGDLELMPDGKIWGWAEGTLFIFDPATRKVEKTVEVKRLARGGGHMWRGSLFTQPKDDGKVFALVSGGVFEIDVKTAEVKKVGDAKGFSTMVYHKPTGSLFFPRKHELYEWPVAR